MKKWEYNKTVGTLDQEYLEEMGEKGWELVGFEDKGPYSQLRTMVWKREKPGTNSTLVQKKKTKLDRLTEKLAARGYTRTGEQNENENKVANSAP